MENAFFVEFAKGVVWKFKCFASGLYYCDVRKAKIPNAAVTNYSFVTTVSSNKEQFHRREVDRADVALEVYVRLGRPSIRDFYNVLSTNQLRNCPVTVADARRAFQIYGPDVAGLKGKTVKKKNIPAPNITILTLPPSILKNHGNVTLCIDCFFVQGIPFFTPFQERLIFGQFPESITDSNQQYCENCL